MESYNISKEIKFVKLDAKINGNKKTNLFFFISILLISVSNLFFANIYITIILACFIGYTFLIYLMVSKKRNLSANSVLYIQIAFLIVLSIPIFWANLEYFWGNYYGFLLTTFIYFVCLNIQVRSTKKIISIFLKCFALVLCIEIIFKAIELINKMGITTASYYKHMFRVNIGNNDSLGFYLLLLFFIIYANPRKWIDKILLVLIIISIISIQSRTTLLMFILCFTIFNLKIKHTRKILVVLITGIIAINIFFTINPSFKERLLLGILPGRQNVSLNDISGGRIFIYKELIKKVVEYPIFGVGLGNIGFKTLESGKLAIIRSHNIFLELLGIGGVIGFLLYLSLIVYLLKWLKYHGKKDDFILGTYHGYVAILMQGLFSPNMFNYIQGAFLWTIIGACFIISKFNNK